MSRLSKRHVHAALDLAAQNILSAAGDDPFVSRKDIRGKLFELTGVERRLTDLFYRFMDKRDSKPGARITKTDVDATLAYAKEKLIDAYDLNNNGFSQAEIDKMSTTGQLAVDFARILKEAAVLSSIEDTEDILRVLRDLGQGLLFPGYANEADGQFELFHRKVTLERLTKESFATSLGLDTTVPAEQVYIFEQGESEYREIIDLYQYYGYGEELAEFNKLHLFMKAHLRDITHIIVGVDGTRPDSQYPNYFVGIAPEGDLVGFETYVVWT